MEEDISIITESEKDEQVKEEIVDNIISPGFQSTELETRKKKKKKKSKKTLLKDARVNLLSKPSSKALKSRRKTIFELDSYMPLRSSLLSVETSDIITVKDDENTSVSGKVRINLSPLTQKIVGCVIGENLSEEYPWIAVSKQIIEDNIYLHPESSDFLPVSSEIFAFPDDKVLIGYNPQVKMEAQFFICVTKEARDEVICYIEAKRLQRESRVRNAINKKPKPWKDLGSAEDIETTLDGTRDLMEKEFEIEIGIPRRKVNFSFRRVDDVRDGYIELISPQTETFELVERTFIDNAIQNVPAKRENSTQTRISISVDFSSQYSVSDFPTIDITRKEFKEEMSNIAKKLKDFDVLLAKENRSWDLYADDYAKLIPNEDTSK